MLTDEEIFAQLEALERQSKEEKKFYIYFDPTTGAVVHLRNYFENGKTDFPFLEVTEAKLKELDPHGEINISAIQVIRHDGKFVVSRKHKLVDLKINVDSLIHRIPKIKSNEFSNQDYDLLIEQNKKERIFRFRLSDAMRNQYATNLRDERAIGLYLTNERDPNILKRTFQINLYYLSNANEYAEPFDGSEGNFDDMYCIKYFPKYLHVVVE